MSPKKSNKIYLVVKGRQPGLYTNWFGPGGAAEQVTGLPGALYKGFYTDEAAAHWLRQFDRATLASLPPSLRDLLETGLAQPALAIADLAGSESARLPTWRRHYSIGRGWRWCNCFMIQKAL